MGRGRTDKDIGDDEDCGEFFVVNLTFFSNVEAQIVKDAFMHLYMKYMTILLSNWRHDISADF